MMTNGIESGSGSETLRVLQAPLDRCRKLSGSMFTTCASHRMKLAYGLHTSAASSFMPMPASWPHTP